MPKIYNEKNVLDAALERLNHIFSEFDHVYFSVSGGKDSSVMVQLTERVAAQMGRTYDVLYIDFEAQYQHTIQHIEELKRLSHIGRFYHVALPMALRNAVSMLQPKWVCWDEAAEEFWVRPLPDGAITSKNCPWPWYRHGEEFEEFIVEFARWYRGEHGGLCACGVGIRADESLNRFQTVAFHERKEAYKDWHWTTKLSDGAYNFYPIYDWRTEDIWGAVSRMDWEQYTVFLLESIGLYNRDLMLHYHEKIRKFIRWFEKTEGITVQDIPGEADKKLEQQRKVISWRRIARALEKNDFYMKRLSFSQTKSDAAKLERNNPDFYRLLGPVFGSREIEKKCHDRFYDDPGKVWYLIPGQAAASVLGDVIKNFWAASAEAGNALLQGMVQEFDSLHGIVPLCYSDLFAARGFVARQYRVHFMEVEM